MRHKLYTRNKLYKSISYTARPRKLKRYGRIEENEVTVLSGEFSSMHFIDIEPKRVSQS